MGRILSGGLGAGLELSRLRKNLEQEWARRALVYSHNGEERNLRGWSSACTLPRRTIGAGLPIREAAERTSPSLRVQFKIDRALKWAR